MSERTILVWFRKDLRIHDNEILTEAVRKADQIIPVYCFDPRQFESTSFGTLKTGVRRAQFLLESVAALKKSLQELGGDLLIRIGKPEEVIPDLVEKYNVQEVYHHREVASEETRISADVENALWRLKIDLKHFIGHTLFHKEDLPFPINSIPDLFGSFRKKVERDSMVRPCFESPDAVHVPPIIDPGILPSLADLGFSEKIFQDERAVIAFKGGEQEALLRMRHFFWETNAVKAFKQNHLMIRGQDFSTKFSSWISMGCLSPRVVYWEIQKYEITRGGGDYSHNLFLQLLTRDFYRFMFKKHGNKFFRKAGFKSSAPVESDNQQESFELWRTAQTDHPLANALMNELNNTGYISSRGRAFLGKFLVQHLQVNWMLGAAYFEEKLIDYDPASNWGNWANLAGIGTDSKLISPTDLARAEIELDASGEYIRLWTTLLPEIPIISN